MTTRPKNSVLVWAIIASQFGMPFMFSGVAIALPAIGRDLGAGAISLGLVETVFLAGTLAFLLPVGRLADTGDKNALYKLGILGFGLTSGLISLLSWMPGILALRCFSKASAQQSLLGRARLCSPESCRQRDVAESSATRWPRVTLA